MGLHGEVLGAPWGPSWRQEGPKMHRREPKGNENGAQQEPKGGPRGQKRTKMDAQEVNTLTKGTFKNQGDTSF